MNVKSICGVILISRDPAKLADFYAQALGLAFHKEEHGDLQPHFGVDVGQLHFAIHPASNFYHRPETRSSVVAFAVENLSACVERLDQLGAEKVVGVHDEGFGLTSTYADPEGNLLEVVELNYEFKTNTSSVETEDPVC